MTDVAAVQAALASHNYLADTSLATALFLCRKLQRPLFLEGEPGVGKTELAKVLAAIDHSELIRLQCYEGLDIDQAAYQWNTAQQMLEIRLAEARGETIDPTRSSLARSLYRRELLTARPLLHSLEQDRSPILLIDELDRADEPFEAFLLEYLAEYQLTIPELGTIKARHRPTVIITSNRTREIHDAVKRRCIYAWIDYPDADRELAIVTRKVPDAAPELARQAVEFVQQVRARELFKAPGVAETIDWVNALNTLGEHALRAGAIQQTLGVLVKYQEDLQRLQSGEAAEISSAIATGHS